MITTQNKNNELSTDLKVITDQIVVYQQKAGQSIFEIGRRLKWVKNNKLVHGQFMTWYQGIGLTKDFVAKTMHIANNLENFETSRNLGLESFNLIASLPEKERERPQYLASGESKKPDEMTIRELQKLNRTLHQVNRENTDLKNENVKLVQEKSLMKNQIQSARASEKWQLKQVKILQLKLDETQSSSKEYQNLKRLLNRSQTEYTTLRNDLQGLKDVERIVERVNQIFTELAPILYSDELRQISDDSLVSQKCERIANQLMKIANQLTIQTTKRKQPILMKSSEVIEGKIEET